MTPCVVRKALSQDLAPIASPVLMVAAEAKERGQINKSPETFRAIEWAATVAGPKGESKKETKEKQVTSIVVESPKGRANFK